MVGWELALAHLVAGALLCVDDHRDPVRHRLLEDGARSRCCRLGTQVVPIGSVDRDPYGVRRSRALTGRTNAPRSPFTGGQVPEPLDVGRRQPGLVEQAAPGATDGGDQRRRPGVLDQCDGAGAPRRDHVGERPGVALARSRAFRRRPPAPRGAPRRGGPGRRPRPREAAGCGSCRPRRGRGGARRPAGRPRPPGAGSSSASTSPENVGASKPMTSTCTGAVIAAPAHAARRTPRG